MGLDERSWTLVTIGGGAGIDARGKPPLIRPSDIGELDESLVIHSLKDEAVKLVAYTIISVKRDAERIMPEGEGTIVVTDPMNGRAFTSWMIARYAQTRRASADEQTDPELRRQMKIDFERDFGAEGKYLRVYYVVLHRWVREPIKFEERQVAVLKEIRDTC